MELDQIADATLTLLVDQVLTLAEVAVLVLSHNNGLSLWYQHFFPFQDKLFITCRVWGHESKCKLGN